MSFRFHQVRGSQDAARVFGIKLAWGRPSFFAEVKRQAIGDPTETLKQFRKGTLFKPGKGLLHRGLPKTPTELATALAWPVMGAFLLAKNSPQATGGEVMGDFVARSVGSLVGAPLGGAVGQIGGGALLAPVGRAVGKAFDARSEPVANEQ